MGIIKPVNWMINYLVTPMNSDPSNIENDLDLMEFTTRFLKDRGALLESRNEAVEALLPGDLFDALDVEDHITMTRDAGNIKKFEGKKCYSIEFQSPLLEKIVSMAGAHPPFLHADLNFNYLKTQGFSNLIREQFAFLKSKIKVTGSAEVKTRYILLTCKFLAQSDEQKQGLVDFSFNLDTGAIAPGMSGMMAGTEKQYKTESIQGCSRKEIMHIHKLVQVYGPAAVENELAEFKQSMNRRFKRDSKSLDEYYNALGKEMEESLSRTGISDKLIKDREEKLAMIPNELAAKKKDLLNKYSIRISLVPVAVLAVTTSCVRVFVTLVSGHEKMNASLTYNPVTKLMDPMVCKSCGISTYSIGPGREMKLYCTDCHDQI